LDLTKQIDEGRECRAAAESGRKPPQSKDIITAQGKLEIVCKLTVMTDNILGFKDAQKICVHTSGPIVYRDGTADHPFPEKYFTCEYPKEQKR
jgi:hypothetical protein